MEDSYIVEVEDSYIVVSNIHHIVEHQHQVSASHLADLYLMLINHVVHGDFQWKGQLLHVHPEGL